jgi:hypothetical protein
MLPFNTGYFLIGMTALAGLIIVLYTYLTKMAAMTLDDVLIYLDIFSYLFQIVHWAEYI